MTKRGIVFLIIALILAGFYFFPTPQKNFSKLYPYQDSTSKSLLAFRQLPTKILQKEGAKWTYISTPPKDSCILFLHGMAGSYDIWWQQIESLKDDFQIISISLPPIPSLAATGRGLVAILEQEKVKKVILVGSSMGGHIAQFMLSEYPKKVEKAIFANTFPPNHIIEKEYGGLRKSISFYPEWLIMSNFRTNVENAAAASEASPLVKAFLLEQYYGKMSKAQFMSRLDIVIEYFEPQRKAAQKNIPKLIIESDNDPLITSELREGLKMFYPEAEVFTFQGKGHFPYLNEATRYAQVLRGFIQK